MVVRKYELGGSEYKKDGTSNHLFLSHNQKLGLKNTYHQNLGFLKLTSNRVFKSDGGSRVRD